MIKTAPRHHLKKFEYEKGRFFKVRNILNIIFIIGAIAGLVWYFTGDKDIAIMIILGAMTFKIVETSLRFLH